MQCMKVLAAAILCTVVSGQDYAGSAQCGCLEVPATSTRRRDKFCRPHLTDPAERRRYRSCVCRLGLVRNSWGDCITKQECTSCKCFPDRDFNVCGRECPLVCNEPMSRSCSKSCAFGCDCVSGFVRNSRQRGRCVKAMKCGFTCPRFSTFQFCSSTCRPKCGRWSRRSCVTRCTRGDCVCNQGYAEVEHNGETICVPQDQCSQYLQVAPPMTAGGDANISSGGTVFVPGKPVVPVNPGVVTGGAAGISTPGSLGNNGNLGGSGSSGGIVFVPAVPPTPMIPGVTTGGTAGTPVPGLIGVNGNVSAGASSGGVVFIPGTPTIQVNPGVVTGGGAGSSLPGSVGTSGAPHIPIAPMGGTGRVVPSVGEGNQPGSLGSGGASPTPGGAGVGTYTPAGVVARLPGSMDAQGRPSGGHGFGTVAGGISTSQIRPNIPQESGESTYVDASDIPLVEGEIRQGSGPPAAGSNPSNGPNGNSGTGAIGGGLLFGKMPPEHIGNTGSANVGISAGITGQGGIGSSLSAKPGMHIANSRPSGSVILRPGGIPVGTSTPTQNEPAYGIPSNSAIANPITPPNLPNVMSPGTTISVVIPAGTVGVSNVPSTTTVVAGTVRHEMNGNVRPGSAIPSTSTSTTSGSVPALVGRGTVEGASFGNNVPVVTGKAPIVTPLRPSVTVVTVPTGRTSSIGVTGISPQSPGLVGVIGNLSSRVIPGRVVLSPGMATVQVTPGVVTEAGAISPLPGSLGNNGAPLIPNVTGGGINSLFSSAGSGSHPVSLGSGSAGISSHVLTGVTNTLPTGVAETAGAGNTVLHPKVAANGAVDVPLAGVATASSPSPLTSLVATAGSVNRGNVFGLNTGGRGSERTLPGVGNLPGSSSTATVGAAEAVSGVLGGHSANPTTTAAMRIR